ncbi:hypothetical protein WN943_006168 [Citrus x changshan-huyou]
MSASARQFFLDLLRRLQRVKSHLRSRIRFCKTHHIWDLQPPESVSHVKALERQFRDIEGGIFDIQLELERENYHLMYGGGNQGLSKLVSEAAFVRGSQVLGIIPRDLKPLGSLSDSPTGEELVISGMQERITEILNHADAIIFLPGDLATLEALITLAS